MQLSPILILAIYNQKQQNYCLHASQTRYPSLFHIKNNRFTPQPLLFPPVFFAQRQLVCQPAILQISMKQQQDQTIQVLEPSESPQEQIKQSHLWQIIDSHLLNHSLAQQQIDSYHHFLADIQYLILQQGKISLSIQAQFKVGTSSHYTQTWSFEFKQPIHFDLPIHTNADNSNTSITPMMCRLRHITYNTVVKADLLLTRSVENNGTIQPISQQLFQQVVVCKLPVMVGSELCYTNSMNKQQKIQIDECPIDQGGYFISNGVQKVLVAQQRKIYNYIHVIKGKLIQQPLFCQIKSHSEKDRLSPEILQIIIKITKNKPSLLLRHKYLSKDIPLALFLRAIHFLSDVQILQSICDANFHELADDQLQKFKGMSSILRNCLQEVVFTTRKECLQLIGTFVTFNKDKQSEDQCNTSAVQLINRYILPHLGEDQKVHHKKSQYLAYMAKRLICAYLENEQENDWQHLGKKRVQLSGHLLYNLFYISFKKQYLPRAFLLLKQTINQQKNIQSRLPLIFDSRIITNSIAEAICTGSFISNNGYYRSGVSQALKRETSYLASLSHLRKIATPVNSKSRFNSQRLLHNTHFGMYCPAETPQGEKIGIVKHFAFLVMVTNKLSLKQNKNLIDLIQESQWVVKLQAIRNTKDNKPQTKLFHNGNWVASSHEPVKCLQNLKRLRRAGVINYQVSINWDTKRQQIHIFTDRGRLMRPLLIVQHNRIKLKPENITTHTTFQQLRQKGFLQYLDTQQQQNTLIAMTPQLLHNANYSYTHCELHPSMIFGVCASIIPFSNHNQSTKNTLQSAMAKQAIGIPNTNAAIRMDTLNYQLYYHQTPLVTTKPSKHTSVHQLPIGLNPIVAMACFTGYNQEDSIIINQSSIERGLFRTVLYRTYTSEQKISTYGSNKVVITKPSLCKNIDYIPRDSLLERDGLPQPGQFCQDSEVILGQVIYSDQPKQTISQDQLQPKDISARVKRGERCYIDKVMLSQNSKGYRIAKVKTRTIKIPQIGDKFASRHGQKGICGMIFRQQDLPYTADGIFPDMVINPHCIPSRMTIGHLLQSLLAKYAAASGKIHQDATAFSKFDPEKMARLLHKAGLLKTGVDPMTNPYNGTPIKNHIFVGPIYYQRLRHLVQDKMYSRTRGTINALTRQPAKGRTRQGGLRFGEMEKDCILSHGLTEFLKERLFKVSDYYKVLVCRTCGLFANLHPNGTRSQCRYCRRISKVYEVALPYATKLLVQELIGMHIVPRLHIQHKI